MLATSVVEKPVSADISHPSIGSRSKLRHPSQLRITVQEYLVKVWQQLEQTDQPLTVIIAKIDENLRQRPINLAKLAHVMRSIAQGIDDFVGFGQDDDVVMILPQTHLGEALKVLCQIQDYYDEKVQKLEVISTIPSKKWELQSLIAKINSNSH